jgi:hypothetical protein
MARVKIAAGDERNPRAGVFWEIESSNRNLEPSAINIIALIVLNEPAHFRDPRHTLNPPIEHTGNFRSFGEGADTLTLNDPKVGVHVIDYEHCFKNNAPIEPYYAYRRSKQGSDAKSRHDKTKEMMTNVRQCEIHSRTRDFIGDGAVVRVLRRWPLVPAISDVSRTPRSRTTTH